MSYITPEILEYEETMRDALIAQVNLAPMLYKAEADPETGRKAYARLDSEITDQTLHGDSQEVDSRGYVKVKGVDFNPQEFEQFKDNDEKAIAYAKKLGSRAYKIVKDGLDRTTGDYRGNPVDPSLGLITYVGDGITLQGEEVDGNSPTARLMQFIHQNNGGKGTAETKRLMGEFESIKTGYGDDVPYYSKKDVMIVGDPETNTYKKYVGREKAGSLHRSGGVLQTIGGEQSSKFYNENGELEQRQAGYSSTGEFQGTQKFEQDLKQREQRGNIVNELGLVSEYGQQATDIYRQQGGIQDALDETERLGQMSAIPRYQSNDIFGLVDNPQPTMRQGQQQLDYENAVQDLSNFESDYNQQKQMFGDGYQANTLDWDKSESWQSMKDDWAGREREGKLYAYVNDKRKFEESSTKKRNELENRISTKREQPGGGYGQGFSERMPEQGANFSKSNQPSSRGLNQQMLAQAQQGMQAGGRLTARELRTAQQNARMASTARGRGRDFSGVLAELNFGEQASRARETQRQNFAGQVMNTQMGLMDRSISQKQINDQLYQQGLQMDRGYATQRVGLETATSADPFQAIVGRPSGVQNQAGQAVYGNAYAGVGASPQLYNPAQGAQFTANQNAELNTYNSEFMSAKSAEKAGKSGMIGDIVGGIGGGVIKGIFNL